MPEKQEGTISVPKIIKASSKFSFSHTGAVIAFGMVGKGGAMTGGDVHLYDFFWYFIQVFLLTLSITLYNYPVKFIIQFS